MFSLVPVCPRGGCGVSSQGGVCPRGCGWHPPGTRGRHTPRTRGRHTSPQADIPPRQTPPQDQSQAPPTRYYGIRSTSGRYASYWNAFFFTFLFPVERYRKPLTNDWKITPDSCNRKTSGKAGNKLYHTLSNLSKCKPCYRHVEKTSDIGHIVITQLEGSQSYGKRRLIAVTGEAAAKVSVGHLVLVLLLEKWNVDPQDPHDVLQCRAFRSIFVSTKRSVTNAAIWNNCN